MHTWRELLLELLFPKFCCGCNKLNTYLCPTCFNTLDLLVMPITIKIADPKIDTIRAVASYDGVVKKLLHTYKYDFVQGVGISLARCIFYTMQIGNYDCVTAVPLHPNRLAERGFNQAELIAQELAVLSQTPYQSILSRIHFTAAQATITDYQTRQQNMTNQFVLHHQLALNLTNKKILIIDDVCTTGATLNACATELKKAGASQVDGLVFAHGH